MRPRWLALLALLLLGVGAIPPRGIAQPLAAPWNPLAATPGALTVAVTDPAVVRLDAAALQTAGWPVDQIDPQTVRVTRRGAAVAAWVETDAMGRLRAVSFVATGNESPWSREAVYWLTAGQDPGPRLPAPPSGTSPWTWEVDQVYEPLVASRRGDSWFAADLDAAGRPAPLAMTLPVALAAGTAVQLQVATPLPRPGHVLELWHAGRRVAVAAWDAAGTGAAAQEVTTTLERDLPAGALQLDAVLASPGADRVLLDALQVPSVQLPLPTIAPVPARREPRDVRAGPVPGQAGATYLILTHASLRPTLDPLVAMKVAQGDVVAVMDVQWAYDAFSWGERDPAAIRALLALAAATWSPPPRAVLLVGAGTVRMRGGPSRPPTPGLGLSDAPVADPLIPPWLVRGVDPAGEIACDTCYTRFDAADVRDDPLPDLPIGRLPARTPAEATTMVRKLVQHARPAPGPWRSRVLLIGDNDVLPTGDPDPAGPFTPILQAAAAHLPPTLVPHWFRYVPVPEVDAAPGTEASTAALRCRLFRLWDGGHPADRACPAAPAPAAAGAALVVYVGHGSPWQWATTSPDAETPYLVYLYDADGRTAAPGLPIVLAMSCFTGNWANPILQSVDERFLLVPDGGSVATLTSVGSVVSAAQRLVLVRVIDRLTDAAHPQTLGTAHQDALAALPAPLRSLAYSLHILGDPDTRLPPPQVATQWLPVVRP